VTAAVSGAFIKVLLAYSRGRTALGAGPNVQTGKVQAFPALNHADFIAERRPHQSPPSRPKSTDTSKMASPKSELAAKSEADHKAAKDACDAKSGAEKESARATSSFGKKDTRANTLGYRSEKALPA
jgi:hypothetical protein